MGIGIVTAILLDTNALLRLVTAPHRIAPSVRDTLADQANELIVSAASAWELAIKTRIGRLDGGPLLAAWDETLAAMQSKSYRIRTQYLHPRFRTQHSGVGSQSGNHFRRSVHQHHFCRSARSGFETESTAAGKKI